MKFLTYFFTAVALFLLLGTSLWVLADEVESRRCEAGQTCTIGEILYDDNYDPIPGGGSYTCSLASPDLTGSPFAMPGDANGWYSYDVDTTTLANGLYRATMCCTNGTEKLCLDKSFNVVTPTLTAADIASAVWSFTGRSLDDFATLVSSIWSNAVRSLTTRNIAPGENISQEETLERRWTTRFSGDGEVLVGKAYRAKLWVLDYNTELADAVSNPSVTIYDANRAIPGSAPTTMTKIATGTYEIVWTVPTGSVGGRYETVVTINVGGTAPIQDGSYWEVEIDSPAQVKINSITDNTVPSITADATIKNEGGTGYEYKYAYCVVSNQSNQCGGGDDTFYAQDAKFLTPGESWTTALNATVPNTGTYYFKLIVYWGTEKSAAVRQFNAVSGTVCLGDLNNDGFVNLTDFSILLFYWNTSNANADINGDGIVNLTDFSIMLFHWGVCP